jgi:hypothetical protein
MFNKQRSSAIFVQDNSNSFAKEDNKLRKKTHGRDNNHEIDLRNVRGIETMVSSQLKKCEGSVLKRTEKKLTRPTLHHQLTGERIEQTLSYYSKDAVSTRKISQEQMLTYDQLSDLFRRLDTNANGLLDKAEFIDVINKLHISVKEADIIEVFQSVISDGRVGKVNLNFREFAQCYELLYNKWSAQSKYTKEEFAEKFRQEIIIAVRYGRDVPLNKNVYEIYSGFSIQNQIVITEKKVFNTDDVGKYYVETIRVDLSYLNTLMALDSLHNEGTKSQIFWWIDICMEHVEASSIEKYITNFGLPNDMHFRSRFSQFGDPLPMESNANFCAGNGE